MMRSLLVGMALLATIAAAHAFGFGLGTRFGKIGVATAGCTNQLNFSTACNSQYLAVIH